MTMKLKVTPKFLGAVFFIFYLLISFFLLRACYFMLSSAEKETRNSINISFLQARTLIDSSLEDLRERTDQIFADEAFLAVIENIYRQPQNEYLSLSNLLREKQVTFHDETIFLFNASDNILFTPDSYETSLSLFHTASNFLSLSYEEFLAELHDASSGKFRFVPGEPNDLLYITAPFILDGKSHYLILKISPADIQQKYSAYFSEQVSFYTLLPNQNLYYAWGEPDFPDAWRTMAEGNDYRIENDLLTVRKSSVTGFTYMLRIHNLHGHYLFFFLLSVGGFIFLSFFLFFLGTKLMKAAVLSKASVPARSYPSLFDEKIFGHDSQEALTATRQWYLTKIIFREVSCIESYQQEKYGLHFSQAAVFLLTIPPAYKDAAENDFTPVSLSDQTKSFFSQNLSVYFVKVRQGVAGILLSSVSQSTFMENAKSFLQKIHQLFSEKEISLCCYLSAEHHSFPELAQAYEEALYTHEYYYLHSNPKDLGLYDTIQKQACSYLSVPRIADIRERFLSFMVKNEFYAAKQEILALHSALMKIDGLDNRLAKNAIYDIIDLLLQGCSILDQTVIEKLFDKKLLIKETMEIETLGELQKRIEMLLDTLIFHYDTKSMSIKDKIASVASYIQVNYGNPALSLEFLAEEFSVSVQHLSKEFKTAMTLGIQDYIADVRIKNAKHLMRQNPDLSVKQIGEGVGFNNSQTFIRSFKRFESITPGQYKKDLCDSSG